MPKLIFYYLHSFFSFKFDAAFIVHVHKELNQNCEYIKITHLQLQKRAKVRKMSKKQNQLEKSQA